MVLRVFLITLVAVLNCGLSRVAAAPRYFRIFPPTTFREPQDSLPRENKSRLLLLTESEIKEEDLQESRPIAPNWVGSPPAAVAPAGIEETLPTEPEGGQA